MIGTQPAHVSSAYRSPAPGVGGIKSLRIGIGCDNAGVAQKERLVEVLEEDGHAVLDLGAFSPDAVDCPEIVLAVASALQKDFVDAGILLTQGGVGAAVVAGKVRGIRAAFCADAFMARQSRAEADANFLCLDARLADSDAALEIAREWLDAPFAGDARRVRLLAKVKELEKEPAPAVRAQAAPKLAPVPEAPKPAVKIQKPEAPSGPPAAEARPAPLPEVSTVEALIASLANKDLKAMAERVLTFLGPVFPEAKRAVSLASRSFTLTTNGVHVATVFLGEPFFVFEVGPERISSGKIGGLRALEETLALPSILKALQAVRGL